MSLRLPPPAQKEFERAVTLFREGRFALAEGICSELLARFPEDAELAHFGGVLANKMGRYEAAAQRLARCVCLDPRRGRALAALGFAHEQLGQLEEARRAFQAALQAEPQFAEAHNGLGVALFRDARFAEAIASFDRAIALDPRSVETHMNRARALHRLGRDILAGRSWRAALELAPGRDDVRRMGALGLLESGERDDGLAALRKYLEGVPDDALARAQLALTLEAEDADAALREMERAVATPGATGMVHNLHGLLLMRLARWDEARAALERSLALEPAASEPKVNLALTLTQLGRHDEAHERMRESEGGLDARGLTQLAAMYGVIDEADHAMELLARAIAEAPALAEARAARSFERLRRNDLEAGWKEHLFRPTRGRAIVDDIFAGRYPPALPQPLEGAPIFIRVEQGLGDVLLFLRFAAPLAAAGARLTVLGMDARLEPIVARALPIAFADAQTALPAGATDVWAGDLPLLARALTGRDLEPTLPLAALPERVEAMRARLGEGTRFTGVAWRAGTAPRSGPVGQKLLSKEVDARRLGETLSAAPGRVVVVQRHPKEAELARLAEGLGQAPLDLSAVNEDLEDVLALMSILDDYVGVSSTNVHLRLGAGRGGKVLVPFPADWRWQVAGDSPWFPGYSAYREDYRAGWDGALEALRRDLERQGR